MKETEETPTVEVVPGVPLETQSCACAAHTKEPVIRVDEVMELQKGAPSAPLLKHVTITHQLAAASLTSCLASPMMYRVLNETSEVGADAGTFSSNPHLGR